MFIKLIIIITIVFLPFKQAQQIGLLVDKYHFIITNLDAHTIDLEPFQYSGANITILRMVDTSNAPMTEYGEYVKTIPKDEKPAEEGGDGENPEDENPDEINENPEENEEPPNEGEENGGDKGEEEKKEEAEPTEEGEGNN